MAIPKSYPNQFTPWRPSRLVTFVTMPSLTELNNAAEAAYLRTGERPETLRLDMQAIVIARLAIWRMMRAGKGTKT